MFERYNIVDNKDVADAVAKREEKRVADISHNFSHNSPVLAKVAASKKAARAN